MELSSLHESQVRRKPLDGSGPYSKIKHIFQKPAGTELFRRGVEYEDRQTEREVDEHAGRHRILSLALRWNRSLPPEDQERWTLAANGPPCNGSPAWRCWNAECCRISPPGCSKSLPGSRIPPPAGTARSPICETSSGLPSTTTTPATWTSSAWRRPSRVARRRSSSPSLTWTPS